MPIQVIELRSCHGCAGEYFSERRRRAATPQQFRFSTFMAACPYPSPGQPASESSALDGSRPCLAETTEVPPAELIPGFLIGSRPMRRLAEEIKRAAATSASLLIDGESGTGKELIATAIHEYSGRRAGPFVIVDCATLHAGLAETELFGYERGSFTGAFARKDGLFQAATGGTVFLDEISELPLALQPKLLRVLEQRAVRSVGGTSYVNIDARIIAATNQDIPGLVGAGRFRQDLYHRLNVLTLHAPPLRERREDVQILAKYFLQKEYPGRQLTGQVIKMLQTYDWPGNVRELKNCVTRMGIAPSVVGSAEEVAVLLGLQVPNDHASEGEGSLPLETLTLDELHRRYLTQQLAKHGGNKKGAARAMGISLKTIYNWIGRYKAESASGGEPPGK